jgi:Icc-related predicted phosphoesterase
MKILALSDVHCDWDRFPIEDMPEADCAVVAGDLTDFGKRRQWGEWISSVCFMEDLAKKYKRTFWIPGNHELGVSPFGYDNSPADVPQDTQGIILGIYHARIFSKGVWFQGVSCSPCYDMPRLAEVWDYMTADPAKEKAVYESLLPCDVLVSHCPPYGYLDNAGMELNQWGLWVETHIGSKELLAYIERHKPKLVICGHVHEDGGKECMIGTTRVVNAARHWKILEI